MTNTEFDLIFKKGFKQDTRGGLVATLPCLECEKKAYMTKKNNVYIVSCPNNHDISLLNYTVAYCSMIGDLKEQFILNQCAHIIKTR